MKSAVVLATFVLLAGCDASADKEKDVAGEANASVETTDKEQFSLKVPGFEMKVDMPDDGVRTDEDSDLFYPGSRMTGMSIDAAETGPGKESVELRFESATSVDDVAAWYRDPARAEKFTVSRFTQDGNSYNLAGQEKGGNSSFDLRLTPADKGGTSGKMVLRDNQ